jgi:putative DNA primase/helicase
VRRTEKNPLRIEILCSIPLPIEVDVVTSWNDVQPDRVREMWARGAVPMSYGDMALAYKDLFPSAEAARKALKRETQDKSLIGYIYHIRRLSGVSAISYRRTGSRGPAGKLLFDPARFDPVEWLNSSQLAPVTVLGEPVDASTLLTPASESESDDE